MTRETARAHVVMDKELLDEVDRLVGPRHRSEFIADAVAKKVAQERLLKAALEVGGSLENVDIPGWETTESTIEWVRSLRRENDKYLRDDPADSKE